MGPVRVAVTFDPLGLLEVVATCGNKEEGLPFLAFWGPLVALLVYCHAVKRCDGDRPHSGQGM